MVDDRRTRVTLRKLLPLWIVLAGVLPMRGLGTQRTLTQFGQQTWQSDSGLPQNTVHAVLQTRDGFLWIGTEAGLVRFDGVSFRVYDVENTPEFRSDIVSDLKEDSTGALWISTTAGLLREREGAFRNFTAADGLPASAVGSTYLPRRGGVLALTSSGIAALRGDRFERIAGTERLQPIEGDAMVTESEGGQVWVAGAREVFGLPKEGSEGTVLSFGSDLGEIRSVAAVGVDELWVGGRSGIEIVRRGSRTRLTAREGLPSNEIAALLPDGNGGVWIGTSRGLALGKAGTISVPVSAKEAVGAAVQRLYRDREGALWMTTVRGIARVVSGTVDEMPRQSRFAGVLAIFEDREGSMWFGTDNAGISVLRERAFSTVSEQDGLTAGPVRAVFQDHAGTIWMGTDGGGLDRLERGRVSALVSRPSLSSDVVLSIAETGADLWVGTPNGLNRVRHGAVRVFTTEDGLPDDFVRSLYADRDGSLWIGTRSGLSHLAGEAFTSYSKMDGLGSDLIGAMLRDRQGNLWIGTLGGLSRMSGASGFVNATTRDGLGSDAVTSLLEDGQGALWIGTQSAGLSRLWRNRFTALPLSKSGLPETVLGMLEDSAGDLWLSSRRGICRASLSELNSLADKRAGVVEVRNYGVPDGMRISEGSSGGHPSAWRMRDGSLWFATLDGAASVTPESIATNRLPPPTVIEQILLNDQTVDVRDPARRNTLTVPPGERRIEVQYAGLSFVAPQKVRYRYMLEGFDREWVDAGARREAFYTNVPPGTYRFQVVSTNNDGVWSTAPAEFEMKVQPTLLQTWWFYALLTAAAGLLAFAAYRWRVHSVEAQYKAVLQERGRIAREIHDTLAQGYVAISVQLEVTARLLQTSKEAALQQLEQTKELVRGSLAEARSSIWNLRSQNEAETLPSQLAAMLESRRSADGPALKLEIKGTYRPVSAGVEKEIVRVAQEAVTNAVRHAGARHVQATLRYDANTVQLRVADDGRGFAEGRSDLSRNGHFGVQGMRERAARIGARLDVESSPGRGTVVELEMDPRKAEKEEPAVNEVIRIMIVEDHHVVRQGFIALLKMVEGFEIVAEAPDGDEAVKLFRQHKPDVTLMDLRLPTIGGVETITRIRAEFRDARIIVLTTFDGDEDIYRALQAGAKGYLLKGMSSDELIDAIRIVHGGKSRIPAAVAERLAERLSGPTLTERETDVLRLIVSGNSNKEIAGALFISEATVKTHVNSLLGKLGVTDRTQAATTALQRGIVHFD